MLIFYTGCLPLLLLWEKRMLIFNTGCLLLHRRPCKSPLCLAQHVLTSLASNLSHGSGRDRTRDIGVSWIVYDPCLRALAFDIKVTHGSVDIDDPGTIVSSGQCLIIVSGLWPLTS